MGRAGSAIGLPLRSDVRIKEEKACFASSLNNSIFSAPPMQLHLRSEKQSRSRRLMSLEIQAWMMQRWKMRSEKEWSNKA